MEWIYRNNTGIAITSTISLENNNNPNGVSYNISNDRLFVTNTNSSTVSAIENDEKWSFFSYNGQGKSHK